MRESCLMNAPVRTVIGIDYGLKRIGIAVGNTLTQHAEPLEIIQNKDKTSSIQRIRQIARDWSAHEFALGTDRVIGVALDMDDAALHVLRVVTQRIHDEAATHGAIRAGAPCLRRSR